VNETPSQVVEGTVFLHLNVMRGNSKGEIDCGGESVVGFLYGDAEGTDGSSRKADWLSMHEKRVAAHDRRILAIRNLVQAGIRLVNQNGKDIRAVSASQKKTDASLKALIDRLRGGGNGHSKIDLR
jgi:hypothetical protein